jgi:hypothetical protein
MHEGTSTGNGVDTIKRLKPHTGVLTDVLSLHNEAVT